MTDLASVAAADAAASREADVVDGVTWVLVRTLRKLGESGRPDDANRLAADAWWLLRDRFPRSAERVNGTMHYLARLGAPAPGNGQPAPPTVGDAAPSPEEGVMSDRELDVRTEIPARRHELIFETYNGLGAGEGFVLVNDHDPKPLYYQFAAEHEGQFSWDYLEEGPKTWRVRIGRP